MAYNVYFSSDINRSDSVSYKNNTYTFSLDKTNDIKDDLIILYMYYLPKFSQHGVKIGMTKCKFNETIHHAIKNRVGKQINELALSEEDFNKFGDVREIIYWGVCLDAKNESFKDYYVHKQIKSEYAGIVEKNQEWFINVHPEKLIEIFSKIRTKELKKEIYLPRKEQQECINSLKQYFNQQPVGGRFLLNCKMRFGKSYTTYKFCEELNLNKVLILTFIPAVESSWKEDLQHIKKEYKYLTDKNLRNPSFKLDLIDESYVLFLSLQNFLGKDRNNNETKEKIKQLNKVHFDLVVLDEYHFGARNQRTQERIEDFDEGYQKEITKQDVIERFGIKTDKVICLSGTPFKAIAKGEFNKNNSFTYSYFDEQKNKYPNDDFTNPIKPYDIFPDMKIFGYNMSALFGNLVSEVYSDDKILAKRYFSLNKFFETRKDKDSDEPCKFIYEDEIKKWLLIIKGRSTFGSNFPYSKTEMVENNKHTLWLLPSVNSCIAMADLLNCDEYFARYKIINLSAPNVGSGVDAFDYLLLNINEANNTNKPGSIALTVNKLTIGVTVKDWLSVFVLKDLAAPEQYFQSIFRIQTPWVINGNIQKKVGFVYDFNIDRASALLLKYAENTADQSVTKLDVAKLIVKYLPIYMNGDMEKPIEYEVFYQLAQYGDKSNIPLSRKITDISVTTNALDEEIMAKMLHDPDLNDTLKRIFAHSKFQKTSDRTSPPKPIIDGFDTEITKKGRDLGYRLGFKDSDDYLDLDDNKIQSTFEERVESYIKSNVPKEYNSHEQILFINGFKEGYDIGVNAPIKKRKCGYEDGKKYIEKIKEKYGEIYYTKETRNLIENFVRPYLNDINNIPEQYRGKLYRRWYADSFLSAIRTTLKPIVKTEEGGTSVGDAKNILQHILARLVQFLYISVYRETTFEEIFKNADPDVFLEAVGISKQDFEKINKYHVFEEKTLNNYIREFFINESLGATLTKDDAIQSRYYRNSFGWFGYSELEDKVKEYLEENKIDE